jgi:hypothetical protein
MAMPQDHSSIVRHIAAWQSAGVTDDDPLSVCLDERPPYLPLLLPKNWYSRYGRRLRGYRVLGLSSEGKWLEDRAGKGRISRTYELTAACFGHAPFALAPLPLLRARYPELADRIWEEREVAGIEERSLNQWHDVVVAVGDAEAVGLVWRLRRVLFGVETALGCTETPR